MQSVRVFFHICRRCEVLLSQGSVATCLRWDGQCHIGLVANFIRFSAVQKCRKSVKIQRSYGQVKSGNFFETQCTYGSVYWDCNDGQTDRHTEARDQYTFRVVYDSREMQLRLHVLRIHYTNVTDLCLIQSKFHYAIWFEAGRREARSWSATSLETVFDQLR